MSGGYHYFDHSGSSQKLIGPRHRLPIIAAPRPPITSHSIPSTNAQASQPPWMNKPSKTIFSELFHVYCSLANIEIITNLFLIVDTTSNYHENSGFYGHSAVSRDYASISRAHCNDESSAWSNPSFSNPLGNPSFGGALANKNVTTKSDVQKESMDLSASHGGPVSIKTVSAASFPKMLTVNGAAASQDLKNHVTPSSQANVDCKRDPEFGLMATNSSMTNVTANQTLNFGGAATTNDVTTCAPRVEPDVSLVSDNVEFALESLFHSETSMVVSMPPSQNPKDMCVESVEKILKSPEGSDEDDLTILYDSHTSGNMPINAVSDAKPSVEKPPAGQPTNDKAASKVLILKKKNCDCNVQTATSIVQTGDLTSAKSIKPIDCERLNDVIDNVDKNNCDARDTDQISPVQVVSSSSSTTTNTTNDARLEQKAIDSSIGSCKSANENFASKAEPFINVGTEEITFVQVENELEKMFAGIEDSSDPLASTKQPNLSTTSVDAQNNSSLNSSCTQLSQSSTNLFDSVNVPAKTSKKITSKKSKPSGASMKSMKDKQKSSSSIKESSSSSSSLETMKRVPVIHIEGSKENPISAHIINSIKSEEDDVSDGRTSAKRKLGKSDRGLSCFFLFNNLNAANELTCDFSI